MGAPPDLLVTPAQLSRYGVPGPFLARLVPRAIDVQISVAGALGTMAFVWRWHGDPDFSSESFATSDVSPWPFTLDEAFADLVFAAGAYVLGTTYLVDEAGAVSGGDGRLTATRFDVRQIACSSVTAEALTLMRDAVRQPLLTWGDDARNHAAAWVYAVLKRGRGATAALAGLGDENIFKAEEMARAYFREIGEKGKPDSMTDSSTSLAGNLIPCRPQSDRRRGW